MRQAVLVNPHQIEIQDVPKPIPKTGEVLINIKKIGICGSDVHISHGHLPFVKYPLIQGHETSGVVVDASRTDKFKEGDKITIIPRVICGNCPACASGNNNHCENLQIIGVHINGVAAEYVSIPEESVIKIPDDMPFDLGAMIEPLAVAVHAVNLAGDVKGKTAVIVGAGVIGNLVAQVAQAKGAEVMITGRTQYRLDLAKEVGIQHCVNDKSEDVEQAVFGKFKKGADITFECIGADVSVNQCFALSKRMGTVIIAGIFGENQLIDMFTMQDKELTVIGTRLYVKSDFREAIEMIRDNQVSLRPLISAEYSLEEFQEAYHYISDKSNPSMKVIISI